MTRSQQQTRVASTGHALCRHNRRKTRCKECNGGSVCKHGKIRIHCQLCKGKEALVRNWIISSKSADKRNGTGKTNLSKERLSKLVSENNSKCYYCGKKLSLSHKKKSIMTLERINSDKPHSDSNSRLACYKCNISRINERGKAPK